MEKFTKAKDPKPPFVTCIWKDAWADSAAEVTQKDAADAHKPAIMETRGWLVVEDEEGISLFYEQCVADESYRGRTFIPAAMIISVTELKISKPRKNRAKNPPSNPAHLPSNPGAQ
jgi:hypothetical protein